MPNSPATDTDRLEAEPRQELAGGLSPDREQPGDEAPDSDGAQVVVAVSGSGKIVQVLQAPPGQDAATGDQLIGTGVEELWPGSPGVRVAAYAKRAIRSRQVESLELGLESGEAHYDFVFVPAGPDRVTVVARDVSERQLRLSRLESLAYYDDATQLPNQQLMLDELERCAGGLRLKEGRAAVISFDVAVSDGHNVTVSSYQHDSIFQELATRLTHGLRGANDFKTKDLERFSVAARTDYGQFAVVLPDIESGADAERVAERLIETLTEPVDILGRKLHCTVHAGISLFPQDGRDAETLYANALAAMEDASTMQVPYKLHSGTLRLRALQRQDIESQLRTALDQNGFAVEFLPIVDAGSREVVSVEALLRWPQNVFNSMSIRDVVSVAENTGLIRPIGDWVLKSSCEALKAWHSAGWTELRLSINLSVQEFSRSDTPKRISKVLEACGIEPGFIDVEINEYSLFRDASRNYSTCTAMHDMGIGIVVDDYGTGACSLMHLSQSPASALKIDNAFVANVDIAHRDRDACAAILALADRLGLRTIAEGVETEDQAAFLVGEGCTYLQGFLTCKPTSVDGMLEVLARGRRK